MTIALIVPVISLTRKEKQSGFTNFIVIFIICALPCIHAYNSTHNVADVIRWLTR